MKTKHIIILLIAGAILVTIVMNMGGSSEDEFGPELVPADEFSGGGADYDYDYDNPYFSGGGISSNEVFEFTHPSYKDTGYWEVQNWPPFVLETIEEPCVTESSDTTVVDTVTGYSGEYCVTVITSTEGDDIVQSYTLRGYSKSGLYIELLDSTVRMKSCDQFPGKEEECIEAQSYVQDRNFIEILMIILDSVRKKPEGSELTY